MRHMFCNKVSVQLFPKFSINSKRYIFLEREHGHRTKNYYYCSKTLSLFFMQAIKHFGNPPTAALKVSCGIFVRSRWREDWLCVQKQNLAERSRACLQIVWLNGFTTSFKIVSLYSIYFFVLIEHLGKSWTDTLLQNISRTL